MPLHRAKRAGQPSIPTTLIERPVLTCEVRDSAERCPWWGTEVPDSANSGGRTTARGDARPTKDSARPSFPSDLVLRTFFGIRLSVFGFHL